MCAALAALSLNTPAPSCTTNPNYFLLVLRTLRDIQDLIMISSFYLSV